MKKETVASVGILLFVVASVYADQTETCGLMLDGNIHACGPNSQAKAFGVDAAGFHCRITGEADLIKECYVSADARKPNGNYSKIFSLSAKWYVLSPIPLAMVRMNAAGNGDDLGQRWYSQGGIRLFLDNVQTNENVAPGANIVRVQGKFQMANASDVVQYEIRQDDLYRVGESQGLFARLAAVEAVTPPAILEAAGLNSLRLFGGTYRIDSIEIKFNGVPVTPITWSGWTAIHAEVSGGVFKVLWDTPNAGPSGERYRIWDVTQTGVYSGVGDWVAASNIHQKETMFQADLNGNGTIGN